MDDPDAGMPQPFVHWVVYKIPATAKGLPEALPAGAVSAPGLAGAIQGLERLRRVPPREYASDAARLPWPGAAAGKAAPLHVHGVRAGRAARGRRRAQQGRAAEGHGRPHRRAGPARRPVQSGRLPLHPATDRRVVNDLDAVAVRIAEVARPRAVAMGARLRIDRDAAALEKRRPPIDIVRLPHNQAEMIERRLAPGRAAADPPTGAAPGCRCPTIR